MEKIVSAPTLVLIILLACVVVIGCSKHYDVTSTNSSQPSNNPLVNTWIPNNLEFGKVTGTDTIITQWQFGGSMPASNLTFTSTSTANNYTWGSVSGTWTLSPDKTSLAFTSNNASTPQNFVISNFSGTSEPASYTATVRSLSNTVLVLQFTGSFYYHPPNGSAAAYVGVERISYKAQ